jgi:hypothetical protein
MTWQWHRGTILAAAVLAAGFISGCAQASPAASTPTPMRAVITPVLGGDKTALQTLVPANALSDLEVAAAKRGVATYTGYACTIAPAGCACEAPLVQESSFTFTPSNQLLYDFTIKGGQPAQWQLDHAGFNQWSYTAPVALGEAQQDALLLALLTFTSNGYQVTQVATFRTGEVAKCDNVEFHQLESPASNATP